MGTTILIWHLVIGIEIEKVKSIDDDNYDYAKLDEAALSFYASFSSLRTKNTHLCHKRTIRVCPAIQKSLPDTS